MPEREPKVRRGMLLLQRDSPPRTGGLPTRYVLWAVASVRVGNSGNASVKLIRADSEVDVEATARFPDAAVREPFKVFALSQADLLRVWDHL